MVAVLMFGTERKYENALTVFTVLSWYYKRIMTILH